MVKFIYTNIIIIIILILVINFPLYHLYKIQYPIIINPCLKTGDLILTKNIPYLSETNTVSGIKHYMLYSLYYYFFQTYYTHIGTILIIDNIPYILHMTKQKRKKISKPSLMKFTDFYRKYTGDIFLYKYKSYIDEFDLEKIKKINNKYTLLDQSEYFNREKYKKINKIFCSDFIALILYNLNIFPQYNINNNYYPHSIINILKTKYTKPFLVKFK